MNLAGLVPLVLQGVDLSNSPADFLLGGASVTGWTLALYFLWAFVTDRIVPRQQADQWRDLYLQEAKDNEGLIIPVVITVYADRSYTFITKTPPVAVLIKREAGIAKGRGEPNRNKVGKITMKQVEAIAKLKLPDLTAADLKAAVNTVLGTARSMGVEISG